MYRRMLRSLRRGLTGDRFWGCLWPWRRQRDDEVVLCQEEDPTGVSLVRSASLPNESSFKNEKVKEKPFSDYLQENLRQLSHQELESFTPLVKKLAKGGTYSSRILACIVLPPVYTGVSAKAKGSLRHQFRQLSKDKHPLVRRIAASQIGELGKVVEAQHLKCDLIPILADLAWDDEENVRAMATQACFTIANVLQQHENIKKMTASTLCQCDGDSL